MHTKRKIITAASALFVGATVNACGSEATQLRPAAGAREVLGAEAAGSTENDVRFVAQSTDWPGETPIAKEVTPILVTIENHRGAPVAIRYRDFVLVSSDGTRYAALPPFKIKGAVLDPAVGYGHMAPAFHHHGFRAAPYYGPVYPGIPLYSAFSTDPHYDVAYEHWKRESLPTPSMLALALPEGVIGPDGRLAGWLYFQKVGQDEGEVRLRASFTNPESGAVVTSFNIPFEVVE